MEYNFKEIEAKWQQEWKERGIYKVDVDNSRPKFYVLDMSHTHREQVCTWDTHLDISHQISIVATKD